MEKYNYPACICLNACHPHDYDLNHNNRSRTRCCSHNYSPHQGCHDRCCCSCHRGRCRKNLCDTVFSIRLGGLQDGLNFRLRQLLWCEAEFELDDGNSVKGTVVSVGSNFVEVIVDDMDETDEDDLDKGLTEKHHEEEYEERKHKKGKSWIFSTDKIANLKVDNSFHRQCISR